MSLIFRSNTKKSHIIPIHAIQAHIRVFEDHSRRLRLPYFESERCSTLDIGTPTFPIPQISDLHIIVVGLPNGGCRKFRSKRSPIVEQHVSGAVCLFIYLFVHTRNRYECQGVLSNCITFSHNFIKYQYK